MKVSEITTTHLAEYLRLAISIENEAVGTGTGSATVFNLASTNILANSQIIYVAGVAKTETTHYTLNDATGAITFLTAPALGDAITASYKVGEFATTELQVMLDVAKSFVRSYTGLQDVSVTGEEVGTGDGEETDFSLAASNILDGTESIYKDGTEVTETTDYIIDNIKGVIKFTTAPALGVEITADYSTGLDAFEDFVIVVYVLVQDMYDNRSLYVDKTNLSRTVETILGMHSTNLL